MQGFTFLEMVVVVGVLVILTSIAIIYGRTSENQLLLYSRQSEIVGFLSRAKSLAIQTLISQSLSEKVCGYGVHLDVSKGQFFLFQDLVSSTDNCSSTNYSFDNSDRVFASSSLGKTLRFGKNTTMEDVVFVPPDPQTYLTPPPASPDKSATISLENLKGDARVFIRVNQFGQISVD